MARSEENQLMRAVFKIEVRHHSRGERHSAST
jgi:hypothetical protein